MFICDLIHVVLSGRKQCAEMQVVVDAALQLRHPKTLQPVFTPQLIVTSPLVRAIDTARLVFARVWDQLPVVSVEWAREKMGIHTCDRRKPLSVLGKLYPKMQFVGFESDADVLWSPTRRETEEELEVRARRTLRWIMDTRSEEHVVLVRCAVSFEHLRLCFSPLLYRMQSVGRSQWLPVRLPACCGLSDRPAACQLLT
jgi:hypothetical protein